MIANMKTPQVRKLAQHAIAVLIEFRRENPTMRTAQMMRVQDIHDFCGELSPTTQIQLSLEDYKALTQLPGVED